MIQPFDIVKIYFMLILLALYVVTIGITISMFFLIVSKGHFEYKDNDKLWYRDIILYALFGPIACFVSSAVYIYLHP